MMLRFLIFFLFCEAGCKSFSVRHCITYQGFHRIVVAESHHFQALTYAVDIITPADARGWFAHCGYALH
jgi:hypothetical protein